MKKKKLKKNNFSQEKMTNIFADKQKIYFVCAK